MRNKRNTLAVHDSFVDNVNSAGRHWTLNYSLFYIYCLL